MWFSYAHSLCGATGALFWIKTTLYQYMTKKHGPMDPPSDLKKVGTPIGAGEMAYPNADDLPTDEPLVRYTGGNSNIGLSRMIAFMMDPTTRDKFYYEIELPEKEFIAYAKSIDGSPTTVLSALMIKAVARHFEEQ